MKKRLWIILASVIVVAAIVIGITVPTVMKKKDNDQGDNYNIIMTASTVPPTLAAMDSIKNGGKTFVYLQRAKTYAGIQEMKDFKTFGKLNLESQDNKIDPDRAWDAINLVSRTKSVDKKAKFTIYVTDFNAYLGYAIGIYAGLSDSDYKVVMIEDGFSTYANFQKYFIDGKTVAANDDQPYKAFDALKKEALAVIDEMKEDAKNVLTAGEKLKMENFNAVYALASLPNAEYRIQDINKIKSMLNDNVPSSRLTKIYNGQDSEIKVNVNSKTITESRELLNASQTEKYLTLVLGSEYRAKAGELLTRSKDGNDNNVPTKKLVFIGSRVNSYNFGLVEDLTESTYSKAKQTYTELTASATAGDAFAKTMVEMYNEADWTRLTGLLPANCEGNNVKYLYAFNLLQEYRYTFYVTLEAYGDTYDFLYKGHPSEEILQNTNTLEATRYKTSGIEYNDEMYALVKSFHFEDSLGKRIGMMPGRVAAENFAYLGYDFALGGISSSTYTGYATYIPVEFVYLGGTNNALTNSNVSGRYNNGTLLRDVENNLPTSILNIGSVYKMLGKTEELKTWLTGKFGVTEATVDNYTINESGFLAYSDAYVAANSLTSNTITRNITFKVSGSTVATKSVANGVSFSSVSAEVDVTVPEGKVFSGWALESSPTTPYTMPYYNAVSEDVVLVAIFEDITPAA